MRFQRPARRRFTTTAAAVAAMAALTASQAPGSAPPVPRQERTAAASPDVVWSEVPGDDAYHTELPPLRGPKPPPGARTADVRPGPVAVRAWADAGIPATVLAAYRRAESAVGRSDPGCRLSWHLLAAIGKVESGQASGGRVDARGTTLAPILGPALDGRGFALIRDTDDGAYDGDRTYDRAVGPMQFIPATWAAWGADGDGDGRKDPHNVWDAALAAGHYLCAGPRDLSRRADLDRAILGYNRSAAYLRTVLSWLEFYREGTHPVTDGRGVVPASAGPGGPRRPVGPVVPGTAAKPGRGDGGIVVGPRPTRPPSPTPTRPGPTAPGPAETASPGPSPSAPGTPAPTTPGPTDPAPSPTDTAPTPGPTAPTPGPSPTPGPGCPSGTPTTPAPPSAAGIRSDTVEVREGGVTDDPCTPADEDTA
ncbi:lytic murein transglycosylase [Streptomyces sp. NPDC049916]|uniref:lytic transglycosylase domain-containing protein n=1 Tax=Streptomyces sp. NPDC049916 TaxID=3155156 RepID=UPI0034433F7D